MNKQITLFGNKENDSIDIEINRLQEWIEELEYVLSDECVWKDREKCEWWLRCGGILEEDLETEIKECIKFNLDEIGLLECQKIDKCWNKGGVK